jgi:alkylation response protein AidB-like acyl-CoA dehydrogenase
MYLQLSDEQRMLAEAAATALAGHATLPAARAALDDEAPPDLWGTAIEAGWPGLLSAEDAAGAALGASEAFIVLEQCGRRLADAHLLGHLAAAAVLEAGHAPLGVRREIAAGARGALIDSELAFGHASLRLVRDGDELIADGHVEGVLDAAGATILVLEGVDDAGTPVAGYCRSDVSGLSIRRDSSYDATRETARVDVRDVALQAVAIDRDQGLVGRDLQRAGLAAEAVGATDACLAMARGYAIERVAFGRPIGSYQAIKHKLVEILRLAEAARSSVVAAGRDWSTREFALSANAARVVATRALDYAAPQNMFIHGGIGATWEHDAPLYYRRAEVSRRLAGGAGAAALTVAASLLERRGTARPRV